MKKIAINGFGRIGRLTFRLLFEDPTVEVVAINDLTNAKTLAHLLKYDTAHGNYKIDSISVKEGAIVVDGKEIKILAQRNPEDLPWAELGIDIVIESTGFFVSEEGASAHLKAGAKKVVISAPAKGDLKTVVYNVNHTEIDANDKIISAASCTTNCLAPIAQVLNDNFGIAGGYMTTIHAYTNDQRTQDSPHRDLRRARAGAANLIPTTSGAAVAIGKVLPVLAGKLDGNAVRVPVITGSLVDLVFTLDKEATVEEINAAVKAAKSESLGYTEDLIVSSDIVGTTYGTLFDSSMTSRLKSENGYIYKIVTWYDNEMSYVNQLVRTTKYFAGL